MGGGGGGGGERGEILYSDPTFIFPTFFFPNHACSSQQTSLLVHLHSNFFPTRELLGLCAYNFTLATKFAIIGIFVAPVIFYLGS